MEEFEINITAATAEDASLIADGILDAIGEELTMNLAGRNHTRRDVHGIFARLAAREDTQYSYRNTRIAQDSKGNKLGVCISYDGADLKRMRRAFFKEANKVLGWNLSDLEIEQLPEETLPYEYYLDTLMTLPEFRGRGVGKALIKDAAEKAKKAGKPLTLLCDKDNKQAERLYLTDGFKMIGERPFAGHMMNIMQL